MRRKFPYPSALPSFVLCITLTFGAAYFAYLSSVTENKGRFDRAVGYLSTTLDYRMNAYLSALRYMRNAFNVKPDLSAEDFSELAHGMGLQENTPGIQTMGYIERLNRKQAENRLKKMGRSFESADAKNPDEVDLVVYFEKMAKSDSMVLGIDLGKSPERKAAMNKARDMGFPVATSKVRPMGQTQATDAYAFLVFLPRYRVNADLSTVEKRREALIGFVYAGFRAENIFGRLAHAIRARNASFAIQVYDGLQKTPKNLMLSEGISTTKDINLTRDIELRFANHAWTIEISATKGFGIPYLDWSPFFILLLGSMLSLAVFGSLVRAEYLAGKLILASEEAEKANLAKSIFLANMSHEIRTPLGVVVGFSELAMSEDRKDQRNEYLQTVLRNGKELTRIIGDILDLSKIEAKTLELEKTQFSLIELHEEIKTAWVREAEKKGVSFNFNVQSSIPETLESDRTRINQVLTNLLSNAFKFTAQGFVNVDVKTTHGSQNQRYLTYVISDSGIGIKPEGVKRLFKTFSQVDSSITRKFGGNGLGLALSKEFAIALGGELVVDEAHSGPGARFIFSVPIEVSKQMPIKGLQKTAPSSNTLEGRKILVVEDSKDNQRLIQLLLEPMGAQLTIASNGEEGVEQATSKSFDVILMDIQMPVMDGYKAIEILREKFPKLPIIALTAHALKDERDKAMSLGFTSYLTKPIDQKSLLQALEG